MLYAVIFTRPFLAPHSGVQPELAQKAEASPSLSLGWREPEGGWDEAEGVRETKPSLVVIEKCLLLLVVRNEGWDGGLWTVTSALSRTRRSSTEVLMRSGSETSLSWACQKAARAQHRRRFFLCPTGVRISEFYWVCVFVHTETCNFTVRKPLGRLNLHTSFSFGRGIERVFMRCSPVRVILAN